MNLRNVTFVFEQTGFGITQKHLAFIFEDNTNKIHRLFLPSMLLIQRRPKFGVGAELYVPET